MRRLQRPEAPEILAKLSKQGTTWGEVSDADRKLIRSPLDEMSTRRNRTFCNYCEQLISDSTKGHIEHFAPRNQYPKLVFDWPNLYLSCQDSDHCGHFKDSGKGVAYSPGDLVRPDQEDPEAIFQFFSTGKVEPRTGLDQQTMERAEKTIKVFNLNAQQLVNARSATAKQALTLILDIVTDLEELSEEERAEFLEEEIHSFEGSPFLATARQVFLES